MESIIWMGKHLVMGLGLMWCQLWCLTMENSQTEDDGIDKTIFLVLVMYMIPLVLSVLQSLTVTM